jgi:chromosome segregation ATPase
MDLSVNVIRSGSFSQSIYLSSWKYSVIPSAASNGTRGALNLKTSYEFNLSRKRYTMTIVEKHRTEYGLIDQALNELANMLGKIETLEATAEEHRRDAEELRKSDMTNRKVIEQLEEQLAHEKVKSGSLSTDLGRMTAERNQLQGEMKDMHRSIAKQLAVRDAEREKLQEDLQRETVEREEAVARLRKSFTQIQNLMDAVQDLMGPYDIEKECTRQVQGTAAWQC